MIVAMPQLRHSHHKKGFTLTEIAIVLGIIGSILGAIWTAAGSTYGSYKVSKAQTAVISTAQAVHSMYANIRTTAPSAAGTAITVPGMFPNDWSFITGTHPGVLNPWHTTAAMPYAYVIASGSTQFAIELDAIDQPSCSVLISQFSSTAATKGTIAGLVGAKIVTSAVTAGTPTIGAVPISTPTTWPTTTDCSASGNPTATKGNSIAISFDLSQM